VIVKKAEDIVVGKLFAAFEEVELNGESEAGDVSSELLHELYGRLHRPARRQQVVYQDNVLTRLDRVEVNFERVSPILQIIGNAGRRSRQLPRLADGDEAGI